MQLAPYITDLLYRYECVIVPGFGAFLTQHQSARIDENHTFYPPGKTVSFNRQLQTNDGILAHYTASVENCSYELALQKIRNFTGELSLQLSEGETVSLAQIGEFFLSADKKLQFVPYEKENYSTAAFGLSSFISPSIERQITAPEEKVIPIHRFKTKTAIHYGRYAAIGLIALTLGGFGGLKIYETQVENFNLAEKKKADSQLETQIQEATFVITDLPPLTISIPKRSGKYHIIAGAFRIEENAQKKVQQLSQKGFPAQLIGVNKYGLHQVEYSNHEDRLEALETLRSIQRNENKEAWLLVQELSE
ncbi:MAG: SPOR domain-containing protein [Flavobacteriaceae bacterium]